MPSINDWAAKAARRVIEEVEENVQWRNRMLVKPTDERIAAIIATFAEPLVQLLKECGCGTHSRGYNEESADYPPCPKSYEDGENDKCNCGADDFNAKVDAILAGKQQ